MPPLTFNADYGLFCVLLTMFGLLALVSLAGLAWASRYRPDARPPFALWGVVFVAATFIAYFRYKKCGEDFAQSVYDPFMAGASGKSVS